MRNGIRCLLGASLLAGVSTLSTPAFAQAGGPPGSYYGCPSGYTLQTRGNGARCFSANQPLKNCPNMTFLGRRIGWGPVRDHVGTRDHCVTTSKPPFPPGLTQSFPRACRSGKDTYDQNRGQDRCVSLRPVSTGPAPRR
ncbi:MAG: hypothetical protein R3E48_13765 [Burkholderiaceae bacterium]